jgi:hypothetical protein
LSGFLFVTRVAGDDSLVALRMCQLKQIVCQQLERLHLVVIDGK